MAIVREMKVTYDGYECGDPDDGDDAFLTDKVSINKSFEETTVNFSFYIQHATEAGFAAKVNAVETKFRTPWKDFTWTIGSATILSLLQTGNSGLNARPRITKAADIGDTGRSRKYSVSITFQMPADTSSTGGRRHADIDVSKNCSNRRTATFTGVYTMIPGGSATARAQYEANIAAFASSVLSVVGGDWELLEEPTISQDHNSKILTFTRIYNELIFDQAGGSPDSSKIRRQVLRITRTRVAPGDTDSSRAGGRKGAAKQQRGRFGLIPDFGANIGFGSGGGFITGPQGSPQVQAGLDRKVDMGGHGTFGVGGTPQAGATKQDMKKSPELKHTGRLVELHAQYDCCVDHTVSVDLHGLWDTTILPFIVKNIRSCFAGSATVALTRSSPNFNYDENTISAATTWVGNPGGRILEYSRRTENVESTAEVLVPAWTGDPWSRYRYTAVASLMQTISETIKYYGGADAPLAGPTSPDANGKSLSFIRKEINVDITPLVLGLPPYQIDINEVTRTTRFEFYRPITGGGGSGTSSKY